MADTKDTDVKTKAAEPQANGSGNGARTLLGQAVDDSFRFFSRQDTGLDMDHQPVSIDNHGIRQGADVVAVGLGQLDDLQFSGQYRVIHLVFGDKLARLFRFL